MHIRENFNPLDVLSDQALQAKYRLPRALIEDLVSLVSPELERLTRRSYSLPSARGCSLLRCVFTQWGARWLETGSASARRQCHGVGVTELSHHLHMHPCAFIVSILCTSVRNLRDWHGIHAGAHWLHVGDYLRLTHCFTNCIQ